MKYAIRIPANDSLERDIVERIPRPVGRPGQKPLSEDDAAELPSFPVERGAAVTEPNRLQPGESVAAAGAADDDRQLVADQLAAAVGEDRRSAGETCARVLAALGQGAAASEAVCKLAEDDHGIAPTRRLATQERGEF